MRNTIIAIMTLAFAAGTLAPVVEAKGKGKAKMKALTAGHCGAMMYYSNKKHHCMDARNKVPKKK